MCDIVPIQDCVLAPVTEEALGLADTQRFGREAVVTRVDRPLCRAL